MQGERRLDKRTELPSRLVIKRLDDDSSKEVTIDITDLSKSGIGFECEEALQIGEVYETYLTIWTEEVIHAFLRIVRIDLKDKGYGYGAVFVGMPEMDSSRIGVYQIVNDKSPYTLKMPNAVAENSGGFLAKHPELIYTNIPASTTLAAIPARETRRAPGRVQRLLRTPAAM